MDSIDKPRSSPNSCPSCGGPLDAGAGNLCPRCLMAGAMQPTVGEPGQDVDAATPGIDEVAAAFPDLEILELVGRGGMGAVFKARQKSLDRFVALKILPRSLAAEPKFSSYFEGEAKALAALSHPNIVTIHDFGHAGGFYFLLMEYVDGVNLRELLRSRKLSPEEALAIVPPLCEALQFAHDRGIVHRDIKPENLLLDRAGRIKIADFGIAKIVGGGVADGADSAGTPAYMSPEQRVAPEKVDSRADIYSLGVVFYEMLTGERPDAAMLPPSGKVAIDVRLDEVVLRALQNEPELRWQTAAEFGTRVQTIVSDQPSAATRDAAAPEPAGDRVTRQIGTWSLVAILLSGPLLIGAIFVWRMGAAGMVGLGGMFAAFCVPLLSAGVGLVLGCVWLRCLRRSPASRAAWSFVMTVLSLLLPLALALAVALATVPKQAQAQRRLAEEDQRRVIEQIELQREYKLAKQAVVEAQDRDEGAETIAALQARQAEASEKIDSLPPRGAGRGGVDVAISPWVLVAIPLLLVLPVGGIGVVLGWRHLAWLRGGAAPRVGILHAMIGALFWPVIIAAGITFAIVLVPLNHGRSANLGLSLGICAAIAVSVWMIRSTWLWAKNEPGSVGFAPRGVIGACLIGVGLLISINWLIDLSDAQSHRSELRRRQLVTLFQQRSAAEAQKFSAEAEIHGIEVNEINAKSEAERQQFQRDKQAPTRRIERARSELERIDFEQMNLRAAQMQDDHWWGKALVPILVGLALVIPGISLISKRTDGRDSIE